MELTLVFQATLGYRRFQIGCVFAHGRPGQPFRSQIVLYRPDIG